MIKQELFQSNAASSHSQQPHTMSATALTLETASTLLLFLCRRSPSHDIVVIKINESAAQENQSEC